MSTVYCSVHRQHLSRFIRDGLGLSVNDGNFFSGDLRLLSGERVWNGDHLSLDNRRLHTDTQPLTTQLHTCTSLQLLCDYTLEIFGRTHAEQQKIIQLRMRNAIGFCNLWLCWSNTHDTTKHHNSAHLGDCVEVFSIKRESHHTGVCLNCDVCCIRMKAVDGVRPSHTQVGFVINPQLCRKTSSALHYNTTYKHMQYMSSASALHSQQLTALLTLYTSVCVCVWQ